MNTMNTRRGIGVNRYKLTHTRFPVTPAGPNHPPKSNQTTRKDTKVEFLRKDQIASQIGRMKRLKRPRLLELQGKRVALGRVQQNSKTRQLGEVSTLDKVKGALRNPSSYA